MGLEEMKGKFCGYNKRTLIAVIVLVIVAGGTFYAGAKYEKSKLSKLGLLNAVTTIDVCKAKDSVVGTITAKTDNFISVKTSDGSVQNVAIADSLKSGKKSGPALAALAVGQEVTFNGVKNVDGSFSAQAIGKTPVATPAK